MAPVGRTLENHAIAVSDGRILDLCPAAEARRLYSPKETVERGHHLLTPGFINTHTHAAMVLLRGCCDDLPLEPWLRRRIWPLEQRFVDADFVRDGTRLAIAEMIAGGTTCFADMYFFPGAAAAAASEAGMRMVAGLIFSDQATVWARNADKYLERASQVHDEFATNALVSTQFAPDSPLAAGDEDMERLRALADELELRVHLHCQETPEQVAACIKRYGERPLARLKRLGLLNAGLSIAHGVHLDDEDIRVLGDAGASVAHCPESNAKLGSGIAPLASLRNADVNVSIGTDGAASNNDLDMLGEMRSAVFLARAREANPEALSAHQVLAMGTIGGARTLGLERDIGSLEKGKFADLSCFDLSAPATTPVNDAVSQLVFSASRDQVTDTWVAGRQIYAEGQHKTLQLSEVLARSLEWRHRLSRH